MPSSQTACRARRRQHRLMLAVLSLLNTRSKKATFPEMPTFESQLLGTLRFSKIRGVFSGNSGSSGNLPGLTDRAHCGLYAVLSPSGGAGCPQGKFRADPRHLSSSFGSQTQQRNWSRAPHSIRPAAQLGLVRRLLWPPRLSDPGLHHDNICQRSVRMPASRWRPRSW